MIDLVGPELTVEAIRKNLQAAVELPLPPNPSFELLIAVLQASARAMELDRINFANEVSKIDCDGAQLALFDSRTKAAEKRQFEVTLLMTEMNRKSDFNPFNGGKNNMTTAKPKSEKQAAYFESKLKGIKELTGLDVTEKALDWPRQIGGLAKLEAGERAAAEYDFERAKAKDAKWQSKSLAVYVKTRQFIEARAARIYRQKRETAPMLS